jgi:UTP--glucose-1-phosphate uridylyltransferase
MTRQDAIELFGSLQSLADALGVDRSRISQWPPDGELPLRDSDRVMGAALRLGLLRARQARGVAVVIG